MIDQSPTGRRPDGRQEIVIFIHGLFGSADDMAPAAAAAVSAGFRAIRYDLIGRGWSECTGEPHTPGLLVEQLRGVAE